MTNTIGHGHVYPRDDGYKADCGGPDACGICAAERSEMRDAFARDHMARLNKFINIAQEAKKTGTRLDHFIADVEASGIPVELSPSLQGWVEMKSATLDSAASFPNDLREITRTGFRTSEEMAGESLPDPAEAATAAERARCIAMVQQALKEWPWAPSEGTKRFAANVTKLIEGGES